MTLKRQGNIIKVEGEKKIYKIECPKKHYRYVA